MKKGLVLAGITAGATAVVAGMVGITMYNKKKVDETEEIISTEEIKAEETKTEELTEEEVEAKISSKNKIIGAVVAGVAAVGTGIGIASMAKSKKEDEEEITLDLNEIEWDEEETLIGEYENKETEEELNEEVAMDEVIMEEVETEEVC